MTMLRARRAGCSQLSLGQRSGRDARGSSGSGPRADCAAGSTTHRSLRRRRQLRCDVAGAFEQVKRRLHGHLIAGAGALGDLRSGQFDSLQAGCDQRVVNVCE